MSVGVAGSFAPRAATREHHASGPEPGSAFAIACLPNCDTVSLDVDIHIAAAVIVDARGRTLLVRKRGTSAFMQAGGKVAPNESPVEALVREIREELDCGLAEPPVPLGCFRAPAANEPGRIVEAELFAAVLEGEIRPTGEIDEMIWYDLDDLDVILAPLTRNYVLPLIAILVGNARNVGGLPQ
jgi:8-oxo-dGTP diphosphatase